MRKMMETEHFMIEKIEEGCFRATMKSHIEFTLEVAKEFDDAANEITEMKKHVMVFNATKLVYAHADAREYIKEAQERNGTAVAVAFIAKSAFSKVAGNVFLTVTGPSFPMRLFTSSIEAENWAIERYREYEAGV